MDRLPPHLTPRECQLVKLVAEGLSNKEIGHRMGKTEGGVKYSLKRIFAKLRIRSRAGITAWFLSSLPGAKPLGDRTLILHAPIPVAEEGPIR